jgi:hypothetical protein
VNASTEWWRETLGIAARRGNRLQNDLNLLSVRRRSSLFDISGPDRQGAARERTFLRHGSFDANSEANCPKVRAEKNYARISARQM